MISIRKKLISSILLVVFLVTIFLAVITYFSVREEMDEFYDENLKLVANAILETSPTSRTESTNLEINNKPHGEEEYLTQVWSNGKLKYSSHPYVNFPFQNKNGKGRVNFNGSTWRFYKKSMGDITVQLAQDLKERHTVVVEIYGFLLIPIAIQLPLLAVLIWLIIGYSMKPLNDISSLIKNRNSSFLEPLPNDGVPIEMTIFVNELNNLLARLKQSLQAQRRFTADAAHELRTPLTAVRLQLDILKRADDNEEKKIALKTLEKGVLRSTHLVQQLLELAQQEPETAEEAFSKIDLAQVVEECIEQATPMARAKNINIDTKIFSCPFITGNGMKLTVMIGNLINNAVVYTNKNGRVAVTLHHDKNKIILEVADNGIGIPEHLHDRIFDRFYRVSGTGTTGSGLGLSIVRSVADLHKADISVSDGIRGKGTTFEVIFPL